MTEPLMGRVDIDGLDIIEGICADATSAEGVINVHEGGGYYAERIIRRAIEQGNLALTEKAIADFEWNCTRSKATSNE